MRRMLVVGVALLAGLVLATSTSAATPTERKLQRQVTALKKQVTRLQRDMRQLQNIVGVALAYEVCSTALTADALQGTWSAINAREASRGQPPVFPTESAVNDARACQTVRVTRAPTANPPNLTPFKALLSLFGSSFF